jgi:hypothetical protein
MSQLTLESIFVSTQAAAPHPASFVAMCKAAFHQFTASFRQALAVKGAYSARQLPQQLSKSLAVAHILELASHNFIV